MKSASTTLIYAATTKMPKKGAISIVKVPATNTIDNLQQWMSSFLTFGIIYLDSHSEEGSKLFQYVERISDKAAEATDTAAIAYDTSFRQWRELVTDDCPWDEINAELYNKTLAIALNSKLKAKQPFRGGQASTAKPPENVCCHANDPGVKTANTHTTASTVQAPTTNGSQPCLDLPLNHNSYLQNHIPTPIKVFELIS